MRTLRKLRENGVFNVKYKGTWRGGWLGAILIYISFNNHYYIILYYVLYLLFLGLIEKEKKKEKRKKSECVKGVKGVKAKSKTPRNKKPI